MTSSNTNPKSNGNAVQCSTSSNESFASAVSNLNAELDDSFACGYSYINPFVHRVQIDNGFDLARFHNTPYLRLIQIYVLTLLLVPIRAVGVVISLVSAWMFACIGLCGITLDDLKDKPLAGWRKKMKSFVCCSMRMVYAAGSFHYVTFKGQRASPKEAPVLVIAPHSSYIDSIVVVSCGPPSIVAKRETSTMPLLGKIINFSQPIYVQREDPNSRQNTIREIITRARSLEDWPQVAIFPEGTCTNRSALIRFKPGAFYPGVPVQPVLLKYPNKYDTFTWTWNGPGVLRLLWLTMAQFYSRCEIEYLPVYKPSEDEKQDANLYAKNVRKMMAGALGVPTSEYSFDDVIVLDRAKNWKVPFAVDIVEIERKIQKLGLLDSHRDQELISNYSSMKHDDEIDCVVFAGLLQVEISNQYYHHLFGLLDSCRQGTISLRRYLLCSTFCKLLNEEQIKFLRAITPLYAESTEKITRENFKSIVRHAKITGDQSDALFFAIDSINKGCITIDEFENYTRELPKYKYLFRKLEYMRRVFRN